MIGHMYKNNVASFTFITLYLINIYILISHQILLEIIIYNYLFQFSLNIIVQQILVTQINHFRFRFLERTLYRARTHALWGFRGLLLNKNIKGLFYCNRLNVQYLHEFYNNLYASV